MFHRSLARIVLPVKVSAATAQVMGMVRPRIILQPPSRTISEILSYRSDSCRLCAAAVSVQEIAKRWRLVLGQQQRRFATDRNAHPTVVANMPPIGIAQVIRMIEIGDPLGRARRDRATVVDPLPSTTKQSLLGLHAPRSGQ